MGCYPRSSLFYGVEIGKPYEEGVLPKTLEKNSNFLKEHEIEIDDDNSLMSDLLWVLTEDKTEVQYDTWGSSEEQTFYIYTKQYTADWDDSLMIEKLEYKKEWDVILEKFCSEHGFPFKQPSWKLVASYG